MGLKDEVKGLREDINVLNTKITEQGHRIKVLEKYIQSLCPHENLIQEEFCVFMGGTPYKMRCTDCNDVIYFSWEEWREYKKNRDIKEAKKILKENGYSI